MVLKGNMFFDAKMGTNFNKNDDNLFLSNLHGVLLEKDFVYR